MKRATRPKTTSTKPKQAAAASGPAGHRYAAFLRGVSPMNLKMTELKTCLEAEGFSEVKTVLASGNVVFGVARKTTDAAVERRVQAAMEKHLGRSFGLFIRSIDELRELLAASPHDRFSLPPNAKRIVTFLRDEGPAGLKLPAALGEARILAIRGRDALGAYVPSPGDPVFMRLIEKTFGQDVTTRTWDTVAKVAR